nr:MAG TPA: ASCH domain protein [Caudoviricetes sp.]
MKAISLHPYWAMAVLAEEKTIECRSWTTSHRGKMLICSTAHKEPGTIPGHALAVVDLVDVVPFEPEHLEAACMESMPDRDCYAWVFGEVWAVEPFRVRGQQRLYTVPDDSIRIIPEDAEAEEVETIYSGLFI